MSSKSSGTFCGVPGMNGICGVGVTMSMPLVPSQTAWCAILRALSQLYMPGYLRISEQGYILDSEVAHGLPWGGDGYYPSYVKHRRI